MRAQLALGSAIPVVPQHCRPPALKALHSDDILHEECARAVNFRKDRRISSPVAQDTLWRALVF